MIEAYALWSDGDRFISQANSGHAVVIDAGDDKSASSPVELVLMALCACTGSDVVSILRKKREPFTRVEVSAVGARPDTFPKIFTTIRVTYRISGKVTPTAVEHAVRLSEEKYCSVSAMLSKSAKIESVIEYLD